MFLDLYVGTVLRAGNRFQQLPAVRRLMAWSLGMLSALEFTSGKGKRNGSPVVALGADRGSRWWAGRLVQELTDPLQRVLWPLRAAVSRTAWRLAAQRQHLPVRETVERLDDQ